LSNQQLRICNCRNILKTFSDKNEKRLPVQKICDNQIVNKLTYLTLNINKINNYGVLCVWAVITCIYRHVKNCKSK